MAVFDQQEQIDKTLERAASVIIDAAKARYLTQGHRDTSRLYNSIETAISNNTAEISHLLYGLFLDLGVKNVKAGRLYMEALLSWIKRKLRITDPEERINAFWAIRNKHLKEGIPTAASSRYSKNGKRTGWFTDSFNETQEKALAIMEAGLINIVEVEIDNIILEQSREFNKL